MISLPYMMGFIVLLQSFMFVKEQRRIKENYATVCLAHKLPKPVGVKPVDKILKLIYLKERVRESYSLVFNNKNREENMICFRDMFGQVVLY